jgi:hypothetical protein
MTNAAAVPDEDEEEDEEPTTSSKTSKGKGKQQGLYCAANRITQENVSSLTFFIAVSLDATNVKSTKAKKTKPGMFLIA